MTHDPHRVRISPTTLEAARQAADICNRHSAVVADWNVEDVVHVAVRSYLEELQRRYPEEATPEPPARTPTPEVIMPTMSTTGVYGCDSGPDEINRLAQRLRAAGIACRTGKIGPDTHRLVVDHLTPSQRDILNGITAN